MATKAAGAGGAGASPSSRGQQRRQRSKSFGSMTSSLADEDATKKLEKIAAHDAHSKTFALRDEDHTLGNALRYMIMRDPDTRFCGYTVPHPSEAKVHLRVQMDPRSGKTAEDGLRKASEDLVAVCDHLEEVFNAACEEANVPTNEDLLAQMAD